MKNNNKLNTILTGFIPGIILPVLTFILIGLIGHGKSIAGFIQTLNVLDKFAAVISLSVIPNLLLFFVFIWTNRLLSARGVIMATFIVAFLMLIIKII